MKKMPAYVKVYKGLKAEILDGEFEVGELLPTETALEDKFKVSRTTIRRAMELLARERFVSIKQGRGTVVLDYKTRQNLNLVTSISETLRKKGYTVKPRSMYIDEVKATLKQQENFGELETETLIRIQRVQLADDKPIAIMRNYLKADMVPEIKLHVNKFTSLYEFLESKYNILIDSASNKITAKIASFTEAEMLGINPGDSILHISRICYCREEAVCLDSISIVGDFYELEIFMEGRYK